MVTGALDRNDALRIDDILLTYSIYFSYAIFLTDYKKIKKIAGGVKQFTVPRLPDPNVPCPRTMRDNQQ
jgi:hypothetical protein